MNPTESTRRRLGKTLSEDGFPTRSERGRYQVFSTEDVGGTSIHNYHSLKNAKQCRAWLADRGILEHQEIWDARNNSLTKMMGF